MTVWLTLLGYQAVWFAAVIGAGHGLWWPGVTAAALFALWRLWVSSHRLLEARLALLGVGLGLVLETLWVRTGLLDYAAAPAHGVPLWILTLWLAFFPVRGAIAGLPAPAPTAGRGVGGHRRPAGLSRCRARLARR